MNFILPLCLISFFVKESASSNKVIVFDVGSTGTRVFAVEYTDPNDVYTFKQWEADTGKHLYKKSSVDLDELIEKSESEKEKECEKFVKELLVDYIDTYIEEKDRPSVPLLVYSTSGMRRLSEKDRNSINNYLYNYLKKHTKYSVSQENVITLEGWREGLYQWVAVNVIFKAINSGSKTVPILSMGGGSTQFTLELKDKPKNDFLKTFMFEVDLNDKPHYIFLYSFLHFGTDTVGVVHQPFYDKDNLMSPCQYDGGDYPIEITINKTTGEKDYINFVGKANFDECYNLFSTAFKKPDESKCNGLSGIFSDIETDNCVPNPGPFDMLYGHSVVQDAVKYVKPDVEQGITIGKFLEISKEFSKKSYKQVLAANNGDEDCMWTLSNQALSFNFLLRGFSANSNIKDVKLYSNDDYEGQYIAWGLGAAIGKYSNGFKMIPMEKGMETWKIVTISVVCVVVVIVAAVIAIVCVLRRRKKLQEQMIDEDDV